MEDELYDCNGKSYTLTVETLSSEYKVHISEVGKHLLTLSSEFLPEAAYFEKYGYRLKDVAKEFIKQIENVRNRS